jgi:hypothetical protein
MVTVLKYELSIVPGSNVIQMPKGARVLSAQYQPAKGSNFLWVLVDDEQEEMVDRKFVAANTGGTYLENIKEENLRFVGTSQEHLGTLVWHVFEVLSL